MNRVEKARIAIFGGIGLLFAIVLVYGLLYALGFVHGVSGGSQDPYVELDRPMESNPIVVYEFFSYACIHCWDLEPALASWSRNLPEDVEFRKVHTGLTTEANLLGRTHLTLKFRNVLAQNHNRIFRAIHERGRRFSSVNQVADFVDGQGISTDEFTRIMQAKRIGELQSANDVLAREFGVLATPSVIVANKYLVNAGLGRERVIETIEYLIEEIVAGREPTLAEEEPAETAEGLEEGPELDQEQNPSQ